MKYAGAKTRRTWLRFFESTHPRAFIIETRGAEPWLRSCDSTYPAFFIETRGAEPPLGSRIPRSGLPEPGFVFNSTHPVLLHPDPWGRAPARQPDP